MDNGPVFIVGMPRSGTTLLKMMMCAHSKIAIPPETHFFTKLYSQKDIIGDLKKDQNLHKLWLLLLKNKYFTDLKIKNIKILKECIYNSDRSYKEIFKIIFKM